MVGTTLSPKWGAEHGAAVARLRTVPGQNRSSDDVRPTTALTSHCDVAEVPEAAVSIRSKDSRYSTTSSARAGRSSSELIFDLWNFLRPIFFGPIIPV